MWFIVALLAFGSSGCAVVNPGEVALVKDMGKLQEGIKENGMHGVNPLTQKFIYFDLRQKTQEGETSVYSSDLQTMGIRYSLMYRVPKSQVKTLYTQYQGDVYEKLLEPRVEDAIKNVAAKYTAKRFVESREAIKEEILTLVRNDLGDLIQVEDIPIKDVELSKKLEEAIEMKQVEEQKAQAKLYELQKEESQAKISLVQAEAEAKAIRVKAEALKASSQIIELERLKVQRMMISKWDGKSPQTVYVTDKENSVILPLR